ncbi:hypothetical protein MVEN_01099600 [Mycena venus]|uniref:Uncharacterized protein n=1 Tax=Mycena venus TaxID=2733690 RepID=A0A8H6Y7K5_9AGAR|nr:hypothetical protein MVEN_01099600 [Mycena venus]
MLSGTPLCNSTSSRFAPLPPPSHLRPLLTWHPHSLWRVAHQFQCIFSTPTGSLPSPIPSLDHAPHSSGSGHPLRDRAHMLLEGHLSSDVRPLFHVSLGPSSTQANSSHSCPGNTPAPDSREEGTYIPPSYCAPTRCASSVSPYRCAFAPSCPTSRIFSLTSIGGGVSIHPTSLQRCHSPPAHRDCLCSRTTTPNTCSLVLGEDEDGLSGGEDGLGAACRTVSDVTAALVRERVQLPDASACVCGRQVVTWGGGRDAERSTRRCASE